MYPIPSDSPIQFLIEVTTGDGYRFHWYTGPRDVGRYVARFVDLSVTDAPGGRKALSIELDHWPEPPARVHVRIGVILAGETADDVAFTYDGDAILS